MPNICGGQESRITDTFIRRLPIFKGLSYDSVERRWCVKVPSELCPLGETLYFSDSRSDIFNTWLSALYHWGRLIVCHVRNGGDGCPCGVCRNPPEETKDGIKISAFDFSETCAEGIYASSIVPSARYTSSSDCTASCCTNLPSCGCLSYPVVCMTPDSIQDSGHQVEIDETIGSIFTTNNGLVNFLSCKADAPSTIGSLGSFGTSGRRAFAGTNTIGHGGLGTTSAINGQTDGVQKRRVAYVYRLPVKSQAAGPCSGDSLIVNQDSASVNDRRCYSSSMETSRKTCSYKHTSRKTGNVGSRILASMATPSSADILNDISGNRRQKPVQTLHMLQSIGGKYVPVRHLHEDENTRCTYVLDELHKYAKTEEPQHYNADGNDIDFYVLRNGDKNPRNMDKLVPGDSRPHLTSISHMDHLDKSRSEFLEDALYTLDHATVSKFDHVHKQYDMSLSSRDLGVASVSSSAVSSLHSAESKSHDTAYQYSENRDNLSRPLGNSDFDSYDSSMMTDDESSGGRYHKSRRTLHKSRSNPPCSANEIADMLRPWHREVFWVPSISRWRTSFNDEFGLRHTKTFTPSVFGGVKEAYEAAVEYKITVERICRATGISEEKRLTLKRNAELTLKRKRLPRNNNPDSDVSPSVCPASDGSPPVAPSGNAELDGILDKQPLEEDSQPSETNHRATTVDILSSQIPNDLYICGD